MKLRQPLNKWVGMTACDAVDGSSTGIAMAAVDAVDGSSTGIAMCQNCGV
jgi:hypothetical protein